MGPRRNEGWILVVALPQKLSYDLMLTKWASQLNPILANPTTNPSILKNVSLISGSNTINHLLSQKLQGWVITGMHGAYAQVYDNQQTNQTPQLTLVLVSSAPTTIDLMVF